MRATPETPVEGEKDGKERRSRRSRGFEAALLGHEWQTAIIWPVTLSVLIFNQLRGRKLYERRTGLMMYNQGGWAKGTTHGLYRGDGWALVETVLHAECVVRSRLTFNRREIRCR
jgi:hypothetical protein